MVIVIASWYRLYFVKAKVICVGFFKWEIVLQAVHELL